MEKLYDSNLRNREKGSLVIFTRLRSKRVNGHHNCKRATVKRALTGRILNGHEVN
ncbi:unnamed protein product [Brassica napus]|uniref:(rape) hypothetical protein n=1 Tax=Brassica napus TaxID=3708 RepID=A0A816I5F5_BRANA|nr:unnamed protein product [Brassica napus]